MMDAVSIIDGLDQNRRHRNCYHLLALHLYNTESLIQKLRTITMAALHYCHRGCLGKVINCYTHSHA